MIYNRTFLIRCHTDKDEFPFGFGSSQNSLQFQQPPPRPPIIQGLLGSGAFAKPPLPRPLPCSHPHCCGGYLGQTGYPIIPGGF